MSTKKGIQLDPFFYLVSASSAVTSARASAMVSEVALHAVSRLADVSCSVHTGSWSLAVNYCPSDNALWRIMDHPVLRLSVIITLRYVLWLR